MFVKKKRRVGGSPIEKRGKGQISTINKYLSKDEIAGQLNP
jgi:hypothetical protein